MLSFPRPRVRIRGTEILFVKNLMARGFPTLPLGNLPVTTESCTGARLVPFYDQFIIELLYEVEVQVFPIHSNPSKDIGLDLGVNNLVATSDGLLVKGGVVNASIKRTTTN